MNTLTKNNGITDAAGRGNSYHLHSPVSYLEVFSLPRSLHTVVQRHVACGHRKPAQADKV